jgi:Na+/H+-translocating membrane pyrophosphatase
MSNYYTKTEVDSADSVLQTAINSKQQAICSKALAAVCLFLQYHVKADVSDFAHGHDADDISSIPTCPENIICTH